MNNNDVLANYRQQCIELKVEAYDNLVRILDNIRYGNTNFQAGYAELHYIIGFYQSKIDTIREKIKP